MLTESFSGIRGLFTKDLTKEVIENYALSFSNFLKKKNPKPLILLGMDTRPSSPIIKEDMKRIFIKQGIDVYDVGFNSTPAIQHGVRFYKADGGVIISASHNEPIWNGWKFLRSTGSVLKPAEIQEVIDNSKNPKKEELEARGKCEDRGAELRKSYVDFILSIVGEKGILKIQNANFKVVVDPNGGAAATIIKELLKRLNIKVIEKNMELGVFNRLIEPNEKSLAYLSFYVESLQADIGAGWDCDGDRVELVIPNSSRFSKERGRMLSGQYILALLIEAVLADYKGKNKVVVINDATSSLIKEVAKKHGAKTVEVEVGEINVVDKMDELKAPVGGEGSSSGGIFPPSKCRDGVLSLAIILRLMAERNKKVTEILEEFPAYFNSRSDIKCDPDIAIRLRQRLEQYWKNQPHIKEIRKTGDETGGLKIIREETKEGPGWIWYRASKTEAGLFRIITDTKDREYSEKLLGMGEKAFNDCVTDIQLGSGDLLESEDFVETSE
ncbi:hypothetical protein KY331_05555 [Candidatus Woesearchaeota archaeon]|nr:hypothetical protein [Candidatus Woesearchaeota archaeon]